MKLPELYQAVGALLDRENIDADECARLTKGAAEIAALITWAPGIIDPQGQAAAISEKLEAQLRALHGVQPDQSIALLHDALAELRAMVARHDDDLRPSAGGDDDEYE